MTINGFYGEHEGGRDLTIERDGDEVLMRIHPPGEAIGGSVIRMTPESLKAGLHELAAEQYVTLEGHARNAKIVVIEHKGPVTSFWIRSVDTEEPNSGWAVSVPTIEALRVLQETAG